MKPEASSASEKSKVESPKEEVLSEVVEEDVDLSDEETVVLNLLKANSPIELNALKGQAGLSNKKWDKAIKGLTKNGIAKVEKNDDGLFVSLV